MKTMPAVLWEYGTTLSELLGYKGTEDPAIGPTWRVGSTDERTLASSIAAGV